MHSIVDINNSFAQLHVAMSRFPGLFNRLQMHKSGYRNVPKYWFYIVLVGAFAMAMGTSSLYDSSLSDCKLNLCASTATNYAGHSGMPWWALIGERASN